LDGVRVVERAPQRMPSAYFGQQIVMFGRYFEPGETTLRLAARISGEEKSWETRIELPEHDEAYPEIERLWALARIEELQQRIDGKGKDSELREAIIDLGTEYSIVSDYTSMLVVREERFDELGIDRKNQRRTETERGARAVRAQNVVRPTRADKAQPMFGGAPAHSSGGGGGAGAAGPAFIGLLVGLYGLRSWLRRRSDRS
jgi:Ca-activated chloride channel family protein